MISKQEALVIAHEYIEGAILQESCRSIMTSSSSYPKKWVFDIYHRNHEKDTFHTIIHITNTGAVSDWTRYQVGDQYDIE